jgi:hypothetical protein
VAESKPKKRSGARRSKKKTASPTLDPFRAGMPALDSITGVEQFGTGKRILRIIHTNEVDGYDKLPPKGKRKNTAPDH